MDQMVARALGRADAAGLARARARRRRVRRRLRRRLQLRLRQHDLLAQRRRRRCRWRYNPRVGVRAAVRRRRQHRSGGAAGADPEGPQHPRLGDRRDRSGSSAASAPATGRSSASTWRRFATSSGGSRRPSSRATGELPVVEQPAGIPATFEEHAQLMFDLQVLAYQSDLTRVITFMMAREFSGRAYPEIGVSDAHHPMSHHPNDPDEDGKATAKINAYHVRAVLPTSSRSSGDARRRRLAAGSHDAAVRMRDVGRERPHAAESADRAARRRDQGRTVT